jgi:hypothetical protein
MKARAAPQLYALDLSIEPGWFLGSLALFVLLAGIGLAWLGLSGGEAIGLGLLCVTLHWLAETWHQLGHARAARQVGYPMRGIRFGTLALLSTALYPRGEPLLPASIHIHRALGGPKASLVLSVVAGLLVLALWNTNALWRATSLFFFLDNLLVLTLGSLLPLGFTDGSTILHWRGKE